MKPFVMEPGTVIKSPWIPAPEIDPKWKLAAKIDAGLLEYLPDLDDCVKRALVSAIRKVSRYYHPGRKAALRAAQVSGSGYLCAIPGCKKIHPRKGVHLDHVEQVTGGAVDLLYAGRRDWNAYIARMLNREVKWQVLCLTHHHAKTKAEKAAKKDQAHSLRKSSPRSKHSCKSLR